MTATVRPNVGSAPIALLASFVTAATLWSPIASAAVVQVTVGWEPSVHATVTGYVVHVGQSSGMYDQHVDVGAPPVIDGRMLAQVPIENSRDHFIAVSAYDAMASSSPFSTDAMVPAVPIEPELEPEPEVITEIDEAIADLAIATALGLGAVLGDENRLDAVPRVFLESQYGDEIKAHLASGGEVAICDIRRDGLLDLVIGNLYSLPTSAFMQRERGRVVVFDLKPSHDGRGGTKVSRYRTRADFMDEMDSFVETHASCGDIDGDGLEELIVSSGKGGGNTIQILDDIKHGFGNFSLPQNSRGIVTVARDVLDLGGNGETFTAAGDFDGDGMDEVSISFKRPLADLVLILDDAANGMHVMSNSSLDHGYLTTTLATRADFRGRVAPVTVNLDDDAMDELLVIYATRSELFVDVFDDASKGFRKLD